MILYLQLLDCFMIVIFWFNVIVDITVDTMTSVALTVPAGPVVGEILEDVIPMLTENLNPNKDAELRLKCFTLLSRLVMKSDSTLNSQDKFGEFVVTMVRDMIMPNCVWKAGRVAKAIRTTAVSCLWALLQSDALSKERVSVLFIHQSISNHPVVCLIFRYISMYLAPCLILTHQSVHINIIFESSEVVLCFYFHIL